MLESSILENEFQPPEIHFYFHAGVPLKLSNILERFGVVVHGKVQHFPEFEIPDESDEEDYIDFERFKNKKTSNIVNFDTCTLISMVSNLSNELELKYYQVDL